MKKLSGEVRRWRLHRKVPLTITEIAKTINPIVRGWIQYCQRARAKGLEGGGPDGLTRVCPQARHRQRV
jgi:Group II intron, maturase-specific domain